MANLDSKQMLILYMAYKLVKKFRCMFTSKALKTIDLYIVMQSCMHSACV